MEYAKIQDEYEIGFYVLSDGKPYFSYSEPELCLNSDIEIVTPEEFLLFYSLNSPLPLGAYFGEYDEVFWNMMKPIFKL